MRPGNRAVARPGQDGPGWGFLLFDSVLFGVGMIAVTRLSVVVGTVGDLGVGHSAKDIVVTVAALVWVLLVALAFTLSHTLKSPPVSTRAEEREERQAWLADLEEHGAPLPQRLAHRLSIAFVAAPIMGLRRGLHARSSSISARTRVHHFCYSMAGYTITSCLLDGSSLWVVPLTLAAALLADRIGCFFVGWRERRIARRGVLYRPAP